MGVGVLLVEEVRIVGADELDIVLPRELDEHGVDAPLLLIGLLIAVGFVGLMTLELDVIIIAEHALEPTYRLFCSLQVAVQHFLTELASEAGRAGDDSLVVHLQQLVVNTWTRVERVVHEPRTGQLAQVMIAELVLGQQDEVIA